MEYKKYVRASALIAAFFMVPGCEWQSCRKEEQKTIQRIADDTKEEINKKEVSTPKKSKKQAGVIEVKNKKEFDAILEEGRPVVLKVYSPTCPPCKASKPTFEKLSREYSDINFVAADDYISQNRAISDTYGVSSYPTFIFIDASGNVVSQESGFDKESLESNVAALAENMVMP